jgi:hypothetical protein
LEYLIGGKMDIANILVKLRWNMDSWKKPSRRSNVSRREGKTSRAAAKLGGTYGARGCILIRREGKRKFGVIPKRSDCKS